MVTMRYDADGRRVELVTRPNGQAATTVTFRYQGTSLAQELTGGTVSRTYLTDESGTIVKICDPDCTGSNPQYLPTWNGHGDALALWKIETTGALTLANSYTYTTWGAPTIYNAAGQAITWDHTDNLRFRFLYVGREGVAWDDFGFGLGLEYMQARHYSSALGRFLQPDPSAAEANLYGYAGNSPVSRVDPSGTVSILQKLKDGGISYPFGWRVAGPMRAPSSNQLGQAGEKAVRAVYNIGPKRVINIGGRIRIPDGLTSRVLSEIKNVKYQSLTQQIRDSLEYARSLTPKLRFDLYVRGPGPGQTVLSKPLQRLVDEGKINLKWIP